MPETTRPGDGARLKEALERQADEDSHDRGLIVERLEWTPEERLEANASFLRFYWSIRPEGPLIREHDAPAPRR